MSTVLSLIDKYGLPLVSLVVVVWISWQLLKKLLKNQETQINTLNKRIDSLVEKLDDNKVNDTFSDHAEDSNKVQILLYHMLSELRADRISIFEYHNGGKTLNGVSFKRCSNTYEAVSLDITPKIKELQNLPITINVMWNKLLLTGNAILVHDIEDLKDVDSSVYTSLKVDGIQSYYSFPIKDFDGKPMAFLSIEFYKIKVDLDPDHVSEIKLHVNTISGLIS